MKKPAGILFVDHAAALGGAERVLLSLIRGLDRTQWTPHLAGVEGLLIDRAGDLGARTHIMQLPRLRRSIRMGGDWVAGARRLAEIAQREDIDVIYANTVRAALYAALAARLSGGRFVWHMHDFWLSEARPSRPGLDWQGKKALASRAEQVIAISEAVAARLPRSDKVRVVPNGIDPAKYVPRPDGEAFRSEHNLPAQSTVVGMIGRLRPWKGQDRFMKIAARIQRERPDVHFLMVGGSPFGVDDDYPAHLMDLQVELGLETNLIMTGHVADIPPALSAMDIFVHPGDPEPFGLVNIEAMAMELPIAAFNHGALPEIVKHGETGFLVDPGDEDAMVDKIVKLLGNSDLREGMGRAGRARVEEKFQIGRTVKGVEEVLSMLDPLNP